MCYQGRGKWGGRRFTPRGTKGSAGDSRLPALWPLCPFQALGKMFVQRFGTVGFAQLTSVEDRFPAMIDEGDAVGKPLGIFPEEHLHLLVLQALEESRSAQAGHL